MTLKYLRQPLYHSTPFISAWLENQFCIDHEPAIAGALICLLTGEKSTEEIKSYFKEHRAQLGPKTKRYLNRAYLSHVLNQVSRSLGDPIILEKESKWLLDKFSDEKDPRKKKFRTNWLTMGVGFASTGADDEMKKVLHRLIYGSNEYGLDPESVTENLRVFTFDAYFLAIQEILARYIKHYERQKFLTFAAKTWAVDPWNSISIEPWHISHWINKHDGKTVALNKGWSGITDIVLLSFFESIIHYLQAYLAHRSYVKIREATFMDSSVGQ